MALEGGVIQWERVLGMGTIAPVEDGCFDGKVRDYGGESGRVPSSSFGEKLRSLQS